MHTIAIVKSIKSKIMMLSIEFKKFIEEALDGSPYCVAIKDQDLRVDEGSVEAKYTITTIYQRPGGDDIFCLIVDYQGSGSSFGCRVQIGMMEEDLEPMMHVDYRAKELDRMELSFISMMIKRTESFIQKPNPTK